MGRKQVIHLLLAITAGIAVCYGVEADDPVQLGLGIFTTIAWLWISEALDISVTALLVPVLGVFSGIFPVREAFSQFAAPVIFLFMGGFALAAALQKHHLDRAFAVRMLSISGGRPLPAILLMFLTTAFVSMWISNTAAVAMMLPLALGLLTGRDPLEEGPLYLFVLLGLAYSGNLGGMATLIGSPPNAIAASLVGLSFRDWLNWGVPMFLLLFPLMITLLYLLFRPPLGQSLVLVHEATPGNWPRRAVIAIFCLAAACWVFSAPLARMFGVGSGFDSIVALLVIVLLTGSGALKFREFVAGTNWGILILFGGGLTLSALLQVSGASDWLAGQISANLPVHNAWLLLLIVCLFVIFLTELVSNTASAALLIPLFIVVAADFGLPQTGMAVVIALTASCAFMLPVATPPNALVFSTGHVSQRKMMQAGLLLNVTFALVISGIAWWLME